MVNKLLDYFIEYEIMNRFNGINITDMNAIDLSKKDFLDIDLVRQKLFNKKKSNLHSCVKRNVKKEKEIDVFKVLEPLINTKIEHSDLDSLLKSSIKTDCFKYPKNKDAMFEGIKDILLNDRILVMYPILNMNKKKYPLVVFECTIEEFGYKVIKHHLHQTSLASIIAQILSITVSEVYNSLGDDFMGFYNSMNKLKNDDIFEIVNIIEGEILSKYDCKECSKISEFKMFSGTASSDSLAVTLDSLSEIYMSPYYDELKLLKSKIDGVQLPEILSKYLVENEKSQTCSEVSDIFHFGSYSGEFQINEKQAKIISAHQNNTLISVSGPPGTGKTTVLKEIIADTFVRKVKRIVEVWDKPWKAFDDNNDIFETPLGGECLQSIIVTSTNNKAVDNISIDLLSEVNYFSEIANSDYKQTRKNTEMKGIFCAILGKKDNMDSFKTNALGKLIDHIYDDHFNEADALKYKSDFENKWSMLTELKSEIENYISLRGTCEKHVTSLLLCDEEISPDNIDILINNCTENMAKLENEMTHLLNNIKNMESEISGLKKSTIKMTQLINLESGEKDKLIDQIKLIEDIERIFLIGKPLVKLRKLEKEFGSLITMRNRIESIDKNYEIYTQINDDDKKRLDEKLQYELELKHNYEKLVSCYDDEKAKLDNVSSVKNILSAFERLKEKYSLNCTWNDNVYHFNNDQNVCKMRYHLFTLGLKINECYIYKNSNAIVSNLKIIGEDMWFKSQYDSSYNYHDKKLTKIKMLWETLFLCFPVVMTTLHSFEKNRFHMIDKLFDTLLIDEAGQILPHWIIAPLYRAKKAVIVGDVFQLEPIRGNIEGLIDKYEFDETIRDQINIECNSVQHYADKRADIYEFLGEKKVGIILEEHRRCEEAIVSFSNDNVYDHKLKIVKQNEVKPLFKSNLCFLDIRGRKNDKNENLSEVIICKNIVEQYVKIYGNDVKADIGIITPFRNQVALLENYIDKVDIGTVHEFQGQEKDFIILSSVVDNSQKNSGVYYVGEKANFLNVALTRGKKQIIIVGSYDTFSNSNNNLKRVIESVNTNGLIYSLYNLELSEKIDHYYWTQFLDVIVSNGSSSEKYNRLFKSFSENGLVLNPQMHNKLMKHVIANADKSLHIVSPWITEKVLNDEMLGSIENRIESVKFGICFGYNKTKWSLDNIDKIIKRDNRFVDFSILEENIKRLYTLLGENLKYAPPIHTKAMLIDNEFMLIGSHNWLSNSGTHKSPKDEISCIITDKDMIEHVKERYF